MEIIIGKILGIIFAGFLIFMYIRMIKKINNFSEKILTILGVVIISSFFGFYLLDKYNIPTILGYSKYVDSNRWFNFFSQNIASIIGTIISGVFLLLITQKQIKAQIDTDKETKRIENAPLLKYDITNLRREYDYKEYTFGKGRIYNIFFEIENCGLNHARQLKFELYIDNKKRIESCVKQYQSILKKGEIVTFDFVLDYDFNKENEELNRKKAQIIVYYKDLMNNSYIQKINLILCFTNYYDIKYCGYECDIVKVDIEDEIFCKKNKDIKFP